MIPLEIIGIIAGILTTACTIPQALYVFRTKKTRDLSFGFLLMLVGGCFLWLMYGIGKPDYILAGANLITFLLNFYLLTIKAKSHFSQTLHANEKRSKVA